MCEPMPNHGSEFQGRERQVQSLGSKGTWRMCRVTRRLGGELRLVGGRGQQWGEKRSQGQNMTGWVVGPGEVVVVHKGLCLCPF